MTDPRISKLAKVLVHYSLDIQPGQEFSIESTPQAAELSLAVYKEALKAGAHVHLQTSLPEIHELRLKYASDAQLDYIPSVWRLIYEKFDADLYIEAPVNTRQLAGVDPSRQSRFQRAMTDLNKMMIERAARGEFNWCYTLFPTNALAQEADMSLSDYQDFVFKAGLLHLDDPVAAWKEEAERQRKLIKWLAGREQVRIRGADIDLSLSIKGRNFIESAGRENFPSGEIYTSPVEDSINGWVRFSYPAIYGGREIEDVELWLEDGKIVKEKASKGQDFLTATLNTDDGARYLGEWGIGTNYGIKRFTKNILFDEKLGGTIHFAAGFGFPEAGSKNESGIHWDMLCDMADGEIVIDGDLFYKNGEFVA